MDLIPIKSSSLAAVGYNPQSKKLHVLFKSGDLYQYANVTPEMHAGLMTAKSAGGYLDKFIKKHPNLYPYEKLKKPSDKEE